MVYKIIVLLNILFNEIQPFIHINILKKEHLVLTIFFFFYIEHNLFIFIKLPVDFIKFVLFFISLLLYI